MAAGNRPERRKGGKVKRGDGKPLKPHSPSQVVSRSVFAIDHAGHEYAVDLNYFDLDEKIRLYRDGKQHLVAEQPAVFPVERGVIEVSLGSFGVTRVHLVPDDGPEQVLRPVKHSAEYWRSVLDQRHPGVSRVIGWAAIAILLVGLVLLVPQLVELVSHWDVIADRVGTFTSPIVLPDWANVSLTVAGMLAALERALTLRNHWLIDAETWWLD